MPKFFKILILITFLLMQPAQAYAADAKSKSYSFDVYESAAALVNIDNNLVKLMADSYTSVISYTGFLLVGFVYCENPADPSSCMSVMEQGSLLETTTSFMASMYDTRPADTATYIADLLHNNFGLTPNVYAQDTRGLGFSSLQPVLAIWKAFRNITYILFVFFIVIVGFMVMLRKQLNPNTVVTIQSALPKVIITLFLITFSYAIAGFVIDMIFFSIYFIAGAMNLGNIFITDGPSIANALLSKTIFSIGFKYLMGFQEIGGRLTLGINLLTREVFSNWPLNGYVMGGLSQVLAFLIASVALVIAIFRTFVALLRAYINLILNVITAPFQIVFNALPGNDAFMVWFKKIATDAMIFPVVATMILLGIALTGSSPNGDIITTPGIGFSRKAGGGVDPGGFIPPFLLPGNSGTADVLQALIGFGIIMLLPEVVEIVKKTMRVEQDPWGELAWKNAMRGATPYVKLTKLGLNLGGEYGVGRITGLSRGVYTGTPSMNAIRRVWDWITAIR